MPTFLEQCELELKEAEKQLGLAAKRRKEAQDYESRCFEKVEGLKKYILATRIEQKLPVDQSLFQTPNLIELGQQTEGVHGPQNETQDSGGGGEEPNKTEFIRNLVTSHADTGIRPTDILQLAKKSGVTMHQNYPYMVLSKLRKRGVVVKRRDKYYPATPKAA